MRLKRWLLMLVPTVLFAVACAPGTHDVPGIPGASQGFTIAWPFAGGIASKAFIVDSNDGDLLWRTALIINEINRFTGSSHTYGTSDPGTSVPRIRVKRVADATDYCGLIDSMGCATGGAEMANNGQSYPVGGYIYVQVPANEIWFDYVLAHEIGHALGLGHYDGAVQDSTGVATAVRMCNGGDIAVHNCGYTDVKVKSGSDYYAEGDYYGFQRLRDRSVGNTAFDPIGNHEGVSATGGNVVVTGWTIDAYDLSGNEVHAYVFRLDGSIASSRNLGRAQLIRPDVGAAYPWAGAGHGFSGSVGTVGPGSYNVCVYAINGGIGSNVELGCKRINV